MGIDQHGAAFLEAARRHGIDFSSTCTIGRQRLTTPGAAPDGSETADAFLTGLGAASVDALDFSGYEGASIIHDLNQPHPAEGSTERFTAVVDGGTLEHVFHVPNALSTMMQMVAPGGHLLLITPADGQVGHGFYQFSPELFHRCLSEANGFHLELCLLKETTGRRPWYDALDPLALGRRIEPRTRGAYLYVAARRTDADRPIFAQVPAQSDYAAAWDERGSAPSSLLTKVKRLPQPIQHILRTGREAMLRWRGPMAAGMPAVDLSDLPRR